MGVAGYNTLIKKSGTSTVMTDEAMSNTSGNTWQIDAAAKQVWDRTVVPTFEDNAVAIPAGDIQSIDYLFGTVTFTGAKTGPITVSGNYMPIANVVGAYDFNLSITPDILECTSYADADANGGYLTKKYGLLNATASISRYDDLSGIFYNILDGREELLIEMNFDNGTSIARGWFVHESIDDNVDVAGLLEQDLTFQLNAVEDGDDKKSFSWP